MAIRHRAVTVGTTATSLGPRFDAAGATVSLAIQNGSAVTVYLGGPGVTSSDYGYALAAGKEIALDMRADSPVYAAVASSTASVNVLAIEK